MTDLCKQTMQDVHVPTVRAWILRGNRAPQEVVAKVIPYHKVPMIVDMRTGLRYTIGVKAFFVEKKALQKWQGEMDRLRNNTYATRVLGIHPPPGPHVYGKPQK